MVVQDQTSRFPAAKVVLNTKAAPVLEALDGIYEAYGNPAKYRTDNGPPFNSPVFQKFSEGKGIEHTKVYEYQPSPSQSV